jgi:hypothetical protein
MKPRVEELAAGERTHTKARRQKEGAVDFRGIALPKTPTPFRRQLTPGATPASANSEIL